MNKTTIGVIIAVIVVAGGIIWYSQSQKSDTSSLNNEQTSSDQTMMENTEGMMDNANDAMTNTDTSMMPAESAGGDEMMMGGEIKEFTIDGSNFKFAPNSITVNKGDKVRITFKNSTGFHDFVIDEYNVKSKQTQSPTTETLEFTADKSGSFQYYCSVGKHREMGMWGTLTVK